MGLSLAGSVPGRQAAAAHAIDQLNPMYSRRDGGLGSFTQGTVTFTVFDNNSPRSTVCAWIRSVVDAKWRRTT